ncbi:MAG: flavin reductase family protein [Solirubrobacterales bacterium]|nr:flavin reductase family protein [Solirubrobacterales bacterium]
MPLLTDALASLQCEIVAEYADGDDWIVVGQVDDLHIPPITARLLLFAGAYEHMLPRTRGGSERGVASPGVGQPGLRPRSSMSSRTTQDQEMTRAAALPQADASSLVDAEELEARVKEMYGQIAREE